jgi:hypothetical protein
LYYALQQACSNLIGQKGITSAHCIEVKDAIDAVEMNAQPAANFNTDAPYCDSGNPIATIFSDGLESGAGNWAFSNGAFTRWQLDSPYRPYAHSGSHFLYADDYPAVVTDAVARLVPIAIASGAYLHFAHAYDFEASDVYYDGGVLEYSVNNGITWQDAGSLIDFNAYKGTIFTGAGNPLSGRAAFVGTSHGYISTRVNLDSLAGTTVSFRWRMGLDQAAWVWGWWIDDVYIYQCSSGSGTTPPGAATLRTPSGDIGENYTPTYIWDVVAGATSYYLWVDAPGQSGIIKQWYTAAEANCNGTTCSVTPATTLGGGNHAWAIQTRNNVGYGPWSSPKSFSTTLPDVPGAATLRMPSGDIGTLYNPTYTWDEVPDATSYYLWVDAPGQSGIIKKLYTALEANCNGTTCSVTPMTTLGGGNHAWALQARNAAGNGPWSSPMSFSLTLPTIPAASVARTPSGSISDTTPTYTWDEVPGTAAYYLWVDAPSAKGLIKQWFTPAQASCNGTTCSVTLTTALSSGVHAWAVRTWNKAGYGPWSNPVSFTVAL